MPAPPEVPFAIYEVECKVGDKTVKLWVRDRDVKDFGKVKADPRYFGITNPRRFAYHYGLFAHLQPSYVRDLMEDALRTAVTDALSETLRTRRSVILLAERCRELDITFDKRSFHVNPETGHVDDEGQKPRFFLRFANWLHLNRGKKQWRARMSAAVYSAPFFCWSIDKPGKR